MFMYSGFIPQSTVALGVKLIGVTHRRVNVSECLCVFVSALQLTGFTLVSCLMLAGIHSSPP